MGRRDLLGLAGRQVPGRLEDQQALGCPERQDRLAGRQVPQDRELNRWNSRNPWQPVGGAPVASLPIAMELFE
jgi:hypothetical protein